MAQTLCFSRSMILPACSNRRITWSAEDKELTGSDRAWLRGLTVSAGPVSEGDLVSLVGYLVGVQHPSSGESVNCNLIGKPNNHYHIPLSHDSNNTDYQGIVVEM